MANHASGCTGYYTQIWSLPEGTRKGQVFYSRYGLFYEVDGGKSCGENQRQLGEEVRVGQHSVSLRPFEIDSLRQCLMDSWKEKIGAWAKESRPSWAKETRIR
ncbi:hypothetical protein Tco_1518771 [Tanacetum coccineum]